MSEILSDVESDGDRARALGNDVEQQRQAPTRVPASGSEMAGSGN
jgi:hypothetical protein